MAPVPAHVDGHFDERLNRANVAAGLLQPPYFDMAGDDAANYGALGATVGHELIHGRYWRMGRRFAPSAVDLLRGLSGSGHSWRHACGALATSFGS